MLRLRRLPPLISPRHSDGDHAQGSGILQAREILVLFGLFLRDLAAFEFFETLVAGVHEAVDAGAGVDGGDGGEAGGDEVFAALFHFEAVFFGGVYVGVVTFGLATAFAFAFCGDMCRLCVVFAWLM